MTPNLTKQQQLAIDFNKHISLTANAGSGKTFVLKKRFVEIALNEGITLNNIVAITFTEKAANKLYKDISDEINNRLNEELNYKVRYKLEHIRRELVSANISTIHSFCTTLLKEFAPEAEIDASFIPIDPIITNELINLSLEEIFKNIGRNNDYEEIIKKLIRFFGSKNILFKQLVQMIKKRDKIERVVKEYSETSEYELLNRTNNFFELIFKEYFEEELDNLVSNINYINNIVLSKAKNKEIAAAIESEIADYKRFSQKERKLNKIKSIKNLILTSSKVVKTNGYLTKQLRDGAESIVSDIENNLIFKIISADMINDEDELILINITKDLIFIFNVVLKIFEKKKETNGFLDFDDLLLKTMNILKNKDVVKTLSERFKYIMIDEYQDTNEIQFNIFMPMLDYLKMNNLFVVGDEKQSIYMFRDAELEIFDRTKKLIFNQNSTSNLELTHSFRVSPKIALFTNILFGNLFSDYNIKYNEVNYSKLICAREDIDTGDIKILISEDEIDEPYLVAKEIINRIYRKENKSYSDFAILCRERSHFHELENVFIEYKIPYLVIGGTGFYQKQMVQDVYNFLSFIHNPNNDLAFVGLLRAPFYNYSDFDITLISLEEGNSVYEKFKNYIKNNSELQDLGVKLESYISEYNYLEISEIVRRFLVDTGYWGIASSAENAMQEIANLEKLVTIIIRAFERSFFSTFDFIKDMGIYIEELNDESQAQVGNNENAVRIMTLHKSKGLEFNTVILYKLNEDFKLPAIKAKDLTIDREFGILTKVPHKKNYSDDYVNTKLCDIYNYISYRKQIAEDKRLFYVGITRGINNLILSGTVKKYDEINKSFLGFLVSGLSCNLQLDYFRLKGDLDFLINGESFTKENLEYSIPIIKQIKIENEELLNDEIKKENIQIENLNVDISAIEDKPKHELFTASKFISFEFCPVSYKYYYEYAYHSLIDLFDESLPIYDHVNEDSKLKNESLIIGIIAHKILSNGIIESNLKSDISSQVEKHFLDDKSAEIIKEKTEIILHKFMNSKNYKSINEVDNYYNEYEIYKLHNENFLYGIIDKIIFYEDKVLVIDYKTNRNEEGNFNSKLEYYMPQLKFYGYLTYSYFGGSKPVYLKLIFLEEPDTDYEYYLPFSELAETEKEIFDAIEHIRNNSYIANVKNCKNCLFNKKCEFSKIN